MCTIHMHVTFSQHGDTKACTGVAVDSDDRRQYYTMSSTGWMFPGELSTSLVYRCLHRRALQYLADHLIPAPDVAQYRSCLWSSNRNCLTVPRCWLSMYGCQAFYYASPTVWNSLPDELRKADSFDSFKQFLKTILFSHH